jgi:hypothetical protein
MILTGTSVWISHFRQGQPQLQQAPLDSSVFDAHLLASTMLTSCRLWTLDGPLRDAATTLKIVYSALM